MDTAHVMRIALVALVLSAPADAATLARAPAVYTASDSIPGPAFVNRNENGGPQGWESAYEQWGNGFGTVTVEFPVSGLFTFTLDASLKNGTAPALTELRLDQVPIRVGTTFSQRIAAARATYTWSSVVTAGRHEVAVSLMNREKVGQSILLVHALSIRRTGPGARPAEPPGHRDPARQPYSSSSVWNTPLGAGARWSTAADPDTVDLRQPNGTIAAGEWSMPVYVPTASDPVVHFTVTDPTYPIPAIDLHLPADAAPAAPAEGGDHHMIVYDVDRTHLTHFFDCSAVPGGFHCGQSQRDSVCGEALGEYGWGAGLIRKQEIEEGVIPHVLRYSLSKARTRAGDTWISGLAWPAMRSDYTGPAATGGAYSGHVLFGSTIGLPGSVDIAALGLSPPGLALARALQDYGAIQRDTGGDHGLNFYAESAAEGSPRLDAMRADLAKIIPHLAILRNQGPASVGGGGARRRPPAPGIDRAICP